MCCCSGVGGEELKKERLGIGYGGGGTIFGVPNEPPTKTYRMEGGEREKEKEKLVAREEKEE